MDFINDTIEKAKDVFDAACKKTETVVSVQKQRLDAASMKRALAKSYELLGRAVIGALEADEATSAGLKRAIKQIRERESAIAAAEREILRAQGRKFCDNCGSANRSEAHFCYACGQSFLGENNE